MDEVRKLSNSIYQFFYCEKIVNTKMAKANAFRPCTNSSIFTSRSAIYRLDSNTIWTGLGSWIGFSFTGEDEEEWTSEAEGEGPAAASRGGEASGDVTNVKTSPPPGQEGESPHPQPPRLRLKAGLATDPALRASDPSAVLTSALPPTVPGLEYLAALNPAFHSGRTRL
jgi:hypothetical protein